VAFAPRGEVSGLIQVAANGAPTLSSISSETSLTGKQFVSSEFVQAMIALAPVVPNGMSLIYDPQHGFGWQDARGWTVYFGQDAKDISMKEVVYNSIVDDLTKKGVQPTLISVEFLNAPFYK
jgi:hypothetical protein